MQKHLDGVIVGVLTFVVVALILAFKPFGYSPVEVSEQAAALAAGEITLEGNPVDAEPDLDIEEDETTEANDES